MYIHEDYFFKFENSWCLTCLHVTRSPYGSMAGAQERSRLRHSGCLPPGRPARNLIRWTYFTDQIQTYQTGRLTLVHVPSYVSGVGTKTKQGVIGIDEFPTSWISFGMIVNCGRRRPMFLPIYFIYWHHRPSKICPNSWPSLCLHTETFHCRLYTC